MSSKNYGTSKGSKEKYKPPPLSQEEYEIVSDETKLLISRGLTSLLNNPDEKEITFPSSFSNIDRKLVHSLASENGLKSKSRGTGPNRAVTVYRDPQRDKRDGLTLTQTSLDSIEQLLVSNPVTDADKLVVEANTAHEPSAKAWSRNQLIGRKPLLPRTDFQHTKRFREVLPIYEKVEDISHAIENGRIILIVGETGSGKTTQVPQIIMEYLEEQKRKCQIICSMPRRVAAITISERVAYERGESLGKTVGYQIRLDARVSSQTILTYCTNGILLRSLLGGDQWLKNVTHIIIDEVHERDKLTDFTLIVLKDALAKYKNLKLILMSATIDCEKFQNYFRDCPQLGDKCELVEVPGKIYEIKDVYLEHILEGTEYMSSEMTQMKEEKDAVRFFEGNNTQDTFSQRTYTGAYVPTLKERIAMIDPNVKSEFERILGSAADTGSTEMLKHLVHFMSCNDIPVDYQHPEHGMTALMVAAIHSDIDAVDDLIHMDPDLSIESAEGKTALTYAEEAGDSDILEWFNAYMEYCEQKRASTAVAPLVANEIPPAVQEIVDIYEKCHIRRDIDENLILCVLKAIHFDGREGAVLVFLPGYEHIMCVRDTIIQNLSSFVKNGPLDVHILHSRIKAVDQRKVFDPSPPGHRKVILSTNIAETSVTINDVSFVIDCGKVKELSYNAMNGAYALESDWISQSCAEQRRGRAGRTRNGVCFRLYTKKRFLLLKPFKIPELLRSPIAELCLQAKKLAPTGTSIVGFLSKAIDPPLPDVTKNTINLLKKMGALYENEDLTKLGHHLLEIPVDPRFGKMIVYAILLKCLDPVLTIVCCLSYGDMFKLPVDPGTKMKIKNMRLDLSQNSLSDHMVYLNAFRDWEAAARSGRERMWCQENFVSAPAMEMVAGTKQQIIGQLKLNSLDVNKNAGSWPVVKAALTAGSYPNLAKFHKGKKFLRTRNELKVMLHTSSVLKQGTSLSETWSDWVLFEESQQIRTTSHLHTCTVVSPTTVYLFAGPSQLPPTCEEIVRSHSDDEENCQIDEASSNKFVWLHLDEFIHFNVKSEIARSLLDLRIKWHSTVSKSMSNLNQSLTSQDHEKILTTIVSVLEKEDVPQLSTNPMGANKNAGSSFMPSNRRGQSFQRGFGRERWRFEHRRAPQQNWREDCLPQNSSSWKENVYVPSNKRGRSKQRSFGSGRSSFEHRREPQPSWREEHSPPFQGNIQRGHRGRGMGRIAQTFVNRGQTRGNFQEVPNRGRGRGRIAQSNRRRSQTQEANNKDGKAQSTSPSETLLKGIMKNMNIEERAHKKEDN